MKSSVRLRDIGGYALDGPPQLKAQTVLFLERKSGHNFLANDHGELFGSQPYLQILKSFLAHSSVPLRA